ncbi:hypothetical protein EDD17DRAFT_1902512, partial [Pisolithus thermaeus]
MFSPPASERMLNMISLVDREISIRSPRQHCERKDGYKYGIPEEFCLGGTDRSYSTHMAFLQARSPHAERLNSRRKHVGVHHLPTAINATRPGIANGGATSAICLPSHSTQGLNRMVSLVAASPPADMVVHRNWIPSDNRQMQKHTSDTSSEAIQEVPASDKQTSQYTCCPWNFCLYTDPQGWECLELINCGSAPDHFKNKHGIINLAREVELICMWQGCGRRIIRHNYIRHVREHHLGHDRA